MKTRGLTALQVSKLSKPGRYAVGEGAYLQITGDSGRSWIFRYQHSGRPRHMGLGPTSLITLAEAREKAREARRLLLNGIDPIEARDARRQQASLEAARGITFKECAERYISSHEAAWKNAIHRKQWPSTLENYVYPKFGKLPVASIDTALVTSALEPIWASKPETASRVRGRIEVILDWAKARGYREGENPARWRGHLDKLLPNMRKAHAVKHHAALPYKEIPAFMRALRGRDAVAARALEFLILTASRTGEALGAQRCEFDFASKIWTVPAIRMKHKRDHRVPLSPRVLSILKKMPEDGEFIFPGARSGRPLSNMAMLNLLKRMKCDDVTAHGFRSTFRDWASECTNYQGEVAEAALAHTIDDKTEAAYRRGDLLEKRRALMADWAKYCEQVPARRARR